MENRTGDGWRRSHALCGRSESYRLGLINASKQRATEREPMKDTHSTSNANSTLVSFDSRYERLEWSSLGDQVMGGQSDAALVHSTEGVGLFHGTVRLDNGGGF